jgi:hypothetical protein
MDQVYFNIREACRCGLTAAQQATGLLLFQFWHLQNGIAARLEWLKLNPDEKIDLMAVVSSD